MRTYEQIQADREARQARSKRLREAFASLTDTQRKMLADMPLYTCEGHMISPTNTALANYQKPGVSIIGGYQQWKAQNRHIRKGEKSISIWIPLDKSSKTDLMDFPPVDSEPEKVRFRLQSVFDISQTEEMVRADAIHETAVV